MERKTLLGKLIRPINEMSNLRDNLTGLQGLTVFASTKMGKHGCRVKVVKGDRANFTKPHLIFIVQDDPYINNPEDIKDSKITAKQIKDIKYWIYQNRVDLLNFWNRKIEEDEFLDNLDKLDK